ncbi:SH3 domain-containing protein [Eubacteriales bacterium OttesenSCG-928-K08]|nr:SH3 domain-containing protein [Eubacteriales bacterium OttesenSCG-928-K08]
MKKRFFTIMLAAVLCLGALPAKTLARDELKNNDPEKYYILLDLKNQVVTVYEKDEDGEYTRIVRRMICTTGRTKVDEEDPEDVATPTPRGVWKVGGRERFGKFASFSGEYARYWTQIVGGVYFHSVMFGKRNVNAMKANPYRNLGNNLSHGCVRLYVEDAKWLYYYACPGTIVEVSTSEPSDPTLKKKLKSDVPFSDYNALQKNFFDIEELDNYLAWSVLEGAPLRTGNGSNDRKIASLPLGAQVEILQYADPWCKVSYDGKEGYIKLAHITLEENVMQSREDADVIKGTTYVYAEPSSTSERIFKVPTYTTVEVLDDSDKNFVQIRVWDTIGYVARGAITKGWGILP